MNVERTSENDGFENNKPNLLHTIKLDGVSLDSNIVEKIAPELIMSNYEIGWNCNGVRFDSKIAEEVHIG